MLTSLLQLQFTEGEQAQCHRPDIFIMVSYVHRTSFRSQGLMISALLLFHPSDTTWCLGLGNIILRRGLVCTPKQHHTVPKKEHNNAEQKCSAELLSSALTPISLWTVSGRERGRQRKLCGFFWSFSLLFFFRLLISFLSFF